MKTTYRLKRHALDRLRGGEKERSNLTEDEVAQILEEGKNILIANEGRKEHRLFYSKIDACHYIAVVDSRNGDVITILYPDYYKHSIIRPEAFDEAEDMVEPKERFHINKPLQIPDAPQTQGPTITRVVVNVLNLGNRRLASLPIAEYPQSLDELAQSEDIKKMILELIEEAEIDQRDVGYVVLERGSKKKKRREVNF